MSVWKISRGGGIDVSELEWVFEDEEAAQAFLLTPDELLEPHTVTDMKYITYGGRKYFTWSVRFREQAFSFEFPMKKEQYLNFTCSYTPYKDPAYFGYLSPDKKLHMYTCTNGSISKTVQVSLTGNYRIVFKNMAKLKTVRATGNYRVGT